MGQRADNFLYHFDGRFLDWDSMFGAGFREAPKHWKSVYRPCTIEELMRVAREGLTVPSPNLRPADHRTELETLDRFRPAAVARSGLSRLHTIDASPTPDISKFPFRRDEVVLEMKVDPSECFVGDIDYIAGIAPFVDARRRRLEKFSGAFRKYWESMIPLRDFCRYYRKIDTADGTHWILSPRAPRGLPESIFLPEVLIMNQRISPRHVRVVKPDRGAIECPDCEEEEEMADSKV